MAKKAKAEATTAAQSVLVGERRVSATWANNLADVLPGDFTVMKQHQKEKQVWLTIELSDGQKLLLASGDLLDRHLSGKKIFDGKPVEGQECALREGLKIGIKAGQIQFA